MRLPSPTRNKLVINPLAVIILSSFCQLYGFPQLPHQPAVGSNVKFWSETRARSEHSARWDCFVRPCPIAHRLFLIDPSSADRKRTRVHTKPCTRGHFVNPCSHGLCVYVAYCL